MDPIGIENKFRKLVMMNGRYGGLYYENGKVLVQQKQTFDFTSYSFYLFLWPAGLESTGQHRNNWKWRRMLNNGCKRDRKKSEIWSWWMRDMVSYDIKMDLRTLSYGLKDLVQQKYKFNFTSYFFIYELQG